MRRSLAEDKYLLSVKTCWPNVIYQSKDKIYSSAWWTTAGIKTLPVKWKFSPTRVIKWQKNPVFCSLIAKLWQIHIILLLYVIWLWDNLGRFKHPVKRSGGPTLQPPTPLMFTRPVPFLLLAKVYIHAESHTNSNIDAALIVTTIFFVVYKF